MYNYTELIPKHVRTIPSEDMEQGVLYISEEFKIAIHLCACGCGIETVTPIDDGTQGWIKTEQDGKVTLRPSIGNQNLPCRSHYWITDNKVTPA